MTDTEYQDLALDSLALVRIAQTDEDTEVNEDVHMILDQYDREGLVDLVWMLASLTSNLTDQWRESVMRLTPESLWSSVPSSQALVQGMTDSLLREELTDA